MGRTDIIVELNIIYMLQIERRAERSKGLTFYGEQVTELIVFKQTVLNIKFTEEKNIMETLNIYMDF